MATPKWLENLRQQPNHIKKRYLVSVLVVLVCLVIIPMLIIDYKNHPIRLSDYNTPEIQKIKNDVGETFGKLAELKKAYDLKKQKLAETSPLENLEPLKSILDHNVNVSVLPQSRIENNYLILSLNIENLNAKKVIFNSDQVSLNIGDQVIKSIPVKDWPPEFNDLSALTNIIEANNSNAGAIIFKYDSQEPFDLQLPDFGFSGENINWSYEFKAVQIGDNISTPSNSINNINNNHQTSDNTTFLNNTIE